jgi:hypothetical protein
MNEAAAPARRRWPRRLLIALGIVVVLVIVIRLVLDPIASHYTRKELNASEAISGDFSRVHVTVLPPGYEIERLKIIEADGGDWRHPLLYVEHAQVTLDWRRLFHGELSTNARLDQPKITLTQRPQPVQAPKAAKAKPTGPAIQTALHQAIPARVNRIKVNDGEFLFRDPTAPGTPELWLHRIDLVAQNLATRKELARGRRATIEMHATLGHSGALAASASVDPFAAQPEAFGKVALRGWKVAELYDLVAPATKLQTPGGTLDMFAEFKVRDGQISGGVKPVLKDVTVRPAEEGFGTKLKAWVADKSLDLFSHKAEDKTQKVATTVPIEGKLDSPDIQLWPAILGVIRNAFVEGISAGFAHLPPPAAPEKEGVLKQTKNALQKDKGPPKAQPHEDSKEGKHEDRK